MPEPDVTVREVGLRDGLQNVATFFPTASKLAWVTAEYEAGVREMQVCSFVPEKVFPQLEVRRIVERELPDELHSAIAAAGLPKGFEPAASKNQIR